MRRSSLSRAALLFLFIPALAGAATETPKPDAPEADQLQTPESGETPAPENSSASDMVVSTPAVTPISHFSDTDIDHQALDELVQANTLWSKNQAEAASDTALQAYDDLNEVPHRRGAQRAKWREERHQAATVYVQAGIVFINDFVKRAGTTWDALQEGRSRLEDLREVAENYLELKKMLNNAIQQLAAQKPS